MNLLNDSSNKDTKIIDFYNDSDIGGACYVVTQLCPTLLQDHGL